MKHQNEISRLIGKWQSRAKFAEELGVTVDRVHKWASSGSIPSGYWQSLLALAQKNGISLEGEDLIDWHARAA